VLILFSDINRYVLTFPETRCEYLHFLRVCVFASAINRKKKSYCGLLSYGIVSGTWVPTTWRNILALSSEERYYDTTKFHKCVFESEHEPFFPSTGQSIITTLHTSEKSPSQESLMAAGTAQNMEPSFYPCKVYASCPWHMGLSLTVSTQGVSRKVRLCR
jgi:hypothetical protein